MMYHIGLVIAYNMASGMFSVLPLPDGFELLYGTDYMVARHGKKGLCILRLDCLELEHWIVEDATVAEASWFLLRSIRLPALLAHRVSYSFWEKVAEGPQVVSDIDDYDTSIRAAGDNGEWAVLTFGCSPWMFFVDLVGQSCTELVSPIDHELVDSVISVTRSWPPSSWHTSHHTICIAPGR
jgi:hypothetical protein